MKNLFYFACLSLLFGLNSCKSITQSSPESIYPLNKSIQAKNAAVVTAHYVASEVGKSILEKGGNAVDAAIAVQFALDVCFPVAGNIGGGGFMIYRENGGAVYTLDYREKAPLAATADMYLDENGDADLNKSQLGHLAVGVPGSVDGMVQAYKRFSKLKDWKTLVQPSVDIAKKGFKLTASQAAYLNETKPKFEKANTRPNQFSDSKRFKTGELLVQKDLARVYEAIRDNGREGFYGGWVADSIVAEMKRGNGIITLEDLEKYQAKWREPVAGYYDDYKVYSMAPPSSGGVLLIQMLEMLEDYDLKDMGFHSTESIHLITEVERRAFADRAKHLGDTDFYPVPLKEMMDSLYARKRMIDFDPKQASLSSQIGAGELKESEQTTHFCIVDNEGNAVSITTTLNGGYGSKVIVGGTGIFLNNEMDDFSAKPGTPNMFGLIGAEANKIEPEKRMLSSMTPTIIEKNGELVMVLGTPGGSTIITSVLQVALNYMEFGMDANEAVQASRFHHQWLPNVITSEKSAISPEVLKELNSMGHEVVIRGKIGRMEAIIKMQDGSLDAAADTRGDDHASGY
ncbi:gamma-glutamyltransferase [Portibacter lacus]|uniref:Glutathione hydrolase proenzyme n=1 Tax=Portibacter lacus TaxID=1099794 RepID=A0AA37ST90_9BACT|nr:gamma-glutamyltransferase [Portibacter lacus]GLR19682.1 gamma-glutamyltransferase [Portibacter lacus]